MQLYAQLLQMKTVPKFYNRTFTGLYGLGIDNAIVELDSKNQ